jgi:hypothetical protein
VGVCRALVFTAVLVSLRARARGHSCALPPVSNTAVRDIAFKLGLVFFLPPGLVRALF